jgi:DNA-binding protein H-NS
MASYSDLLKQIEDLKRQAEDVRRQELESVIAKIKDMMAQHGITVADLSGGRGKGGKKKGAVAAKYRNPASGETWSGRGRPPRWLAEAEAQGKSRDAFLIA